MYLLKMYYFIHRPTDYTILKHIDITGRTDVEFSDRKTELIFTVLFLEKPRYDKNMPTFYNATVAKSKPINHKVLHVTQNKPNDSHKLAVLYTVKNKVQGRSLSKLLSNNS
jgi:hypothetical protein